MTKFLLLTVAAACLAACSQSQPKMGTDWGSISGAQVAKVNNIKSLISPGVY